MWIAAMHTRVAVVGDVNNQPKKWGGKKNRCAFLLLSSFRTMVWLFVEDFFKVFLDFVPFTSDSVIRAEPGQRVVPFSLHVHRMHTSHGVSVK